uniref:Evasin n=1 Tax=Rhipicephalus pulchellus TaxID=72859 RepID=L7MC89_RHIPC
MVRLFFWMAFFPFACCNIHPYHEVPEGGIKCVQHDLRTPAGRVTVGCVEVCNAPSHIKVIPHKPPDCVTVAHDAWQYMKPRVNYTCELGACESDTCKPYELLIGCWRP